MVNKNLPLLRGDNTMRRHLNLIQFSRAFVPFLVILLHAKAFMNFYFHYNFLSLSNVSKSGGVYYFFALSGFMIFYLYKEEIGNHKIIKQYLYNRFIRIYPIYWIMTCGILIIFIIFPVLVQSHTVNMGKIITSLLLIPSKTEPVLGVAWSLVHTIYFYLIFTLVFIKYKLFSRYIPLLWIFFSIIFSIHLLHSSNYIINFLFNFNNLIFVLGILCAFLVTRIKININVSCFFVSLGIAGFPLSWINSQFTFIPIDLQITTTISSLFLILGFSSIDLQKEIKIPKFANFLGKASFSIYLTHFYCMSAISVLLSTYLKLPLPNFVIAILLITLSTLCGCLVYIFLEKPIYQKLKSYRNKRGTSHKPSSINV